MRPYGSGNAVVDSNMVTQVDTLYLRYSSYINCVAQEQNPFSFLVNKTMACKCADCGRAGLKSKIRSLELTSDSIYNGIPANGSLNSIFKTYYYSNSVITVDSLKNAVNNNGVKLFSLELFTTTKPSNNKGHKLKLKIIFEDGSEVSALTGRLYWN
ncbi:MAG: hypothetical protein ABIO32_13165 [Ferruginibacter sp.]